MNSAGIPSTPIGDQPTTIRAGKVWKRIKKNRERFGPVIASWAGTHVCEEKGDHRPWSIWPSSQLNRRKLMLGAVDVDCVCVAWTTTLLFFVLTTWVPVRCNGVLVWYLDEVVINNLNKNTSLNFVVVLMVVYSTNALRQKYLLSLHQNQFIYYLYKDKKCTILMNSRQILLSDTKIPQYDCTCI